MFQQPAEMPFAFDFPNQFGRNQWRQRFIRFKRKCAIALRLMGTHVVVKTLVALRNKIQMFQTKAQKMVQAFSFYGPDPCFAISIGVRSSRRCFNHVNIIVLEKRIKTHGKLSITISNQMGNGDIVILKPHDDVTALYFHPLFCGVIGRWANEHLAAAQMDEGQTIRGLFAQRRKNRLAKEITSHERVDMNANELLPGCFDIPGAGFRRLRINAVLIQNTLDGRLAGKNTELEHLSDDATVFHCRLLLASRTMILRIQALVRGRPTLPGFLPSRFSLT